MNSMNRNTNNLIIIIFLPDLDFKTNKLFDISNK